MRAYYPPEALNKERIGPLLRRVLGSFMAFSCGLLIITIVVNLGVFSNLLALSSELAYLLFAINFAIFLGLEYLVLRFLLKSALQPILEFAAHKQTDRLGRLSAIDDPAEEIALVDKALKANSQRVKELKEQAGELEKEARVGFLVKAMAHDSRRPFGLLRLALARLNDAGLPAPTRASLDSIQASIGESLEMVDGMVRDIYELTECSKRPSKALIPNEILLEDLIEGELRRLRLLHPSKVMVVDTEFTHNRGLRFGGTRLERVIANLLENALNASVDSCRIRIRTFQRGDEVFILMANFGVRVSERFVNEAFTSPQFGGTGLKIVSRLLDSMGGCAKMQLIHGASFHDSGVEVKVRLPLKPER